MMKGYHMASCNSAINQRFLKGAIVSADPEVIAAVGGECPFCGAGPDTDPGSSFVFSCRTQVSGGVVDNIIYLRSHICYTRQLSQQAELLRRAGEVVKGLLIMGDTVKPRKLDEALTWRENDYRIKTQAQALLPDIEKALEVVK